MPPEPGRVRETCAVTPRSRSCNVSRKPVFIASATTKVATPAATPTIENRVTRRRTAGRYGDLRYRRATNHSNLIGKSRLLGFSGSGLLRLSLRPEQRKKNHVANR